MPRIQEGSGFEKPKECSQVVMKLSATSLEERTLSFVLGDGEVCDAVECTSEPLRIWVWSECSWIFMVFHWFCRFLMDFSRLVSETASTLSRKAPAWR